MTPNPNEQQRAGLAQLSKDCQMLWEENKDMQGRFVNDLSELQRFQLAIQQLEHEQRHEQLGQARQSMYAKRLPIFCLIKPILGLKCSGEPANSTSN